MINRVVIEGFVHDAPTKIVTESGMVLYSAKLVSYRDGKNKKYDCVSVLFTKQQCELYRKLFGETKPRLCVVGHIVSFKGYAVNIQTDYFGIYPFAQILTGGAREISDDENNEVLDEEDPAPKEVDDEVMPF